MTRALAWLLCALTTALVVLAAVLAVVGLRRDLVVPDRTATLRLILAGLGGAIAVLSAAVGLLVARKEPRNAIGWIFLGSSVMLASLIASFGYADLDVYGGMSLPATAWVAWIASWGWAPPFFFPPALVAQLYPNGRPLRGRWRWLLWGTAVTAIFVTLEAALVPGPLGSYASVSNPIEIARGAGASLRAVNLQGGVVLGPPLLLGSLAALVVRFRRSRGIERQQMKWLAFAGSVPTAAFALSFVLSGLGVANWLLVAIFVAALAALALIPVAVGIAIMRYRLYDIDRVVSRTLTYGTVTVILGAAYAGLVLAGQRVFSSFAGGSNLAVAVSTLVVAALFLPLRSRVQRIVDRRFNRHRYDAQRTLEAFGSRLREQVDLDELAVELRNVVGETMQPSSASLWLRETA